MRSRTTTGGGPQLILFPAERRPAARRRPGSRAPTRSERMAERLDALAAAAERRARAARRAGDMLEARAAEDEARGARRAAEIVRAGPGRVAEVLGGRPEAA